MPPHSAPHSAALSQCSPLSQCHPSSQCCPHSTPPSAHLPPHTVVAGGWTETNALGEGEFTHCAHCADGCRSRTGEVLGRLAPQGVACVEQAGAKERRTTGRHAWINMPSNGRRTQEAALAAMPPKKMIDALFGESSGEELSADEVLLPRRPHCPHTAPHGATLPKTALPPHCAHPATHNATTTHHTVMPPRASLTVLLVPKKGNTGDSHATMLSLTQCCQGEEPEDEAEDEAEEDLLERARRDRQQIRGFRRLLRIRRCALPHSTH